MKQYRMLIKLLVLILSLPYMTLIYASEHHHPDLLNINMSFDRAYLLRLELRSINRNAYVIYKGKKYSSPGEITPIPAPGADADFKFSLVQAKSKENVDTVYIFHAIFRATRSGFFPQASDCMITVRQPQDSHDKGKALNISVDPYVSSDFYHLECSASSIAGSNYPNPSVGFVNIFAIGANRRHG